MPVPTVADPIGGKLSIDINGVTIPAFMLGPISGSVAQVLRESERLSGTTTTPSSMLDNPSFDVTFYPNTWGDLQYFFPDNMDGNNFVLGGDTCSLPDPVEVIFNYDCDDDSERSIIMPAARVSFEDNGERNATDDLGVMIHIYPQPTADGQIIYGSAGS